MEIKLGTLNIVSAKEHPELMASQVAIAVAALPDSEEIGVAEIDPTVSDTAAFCERYRIGLERAANCVVIEARRGENRQFAVCMILATTRADMNGIVRKTLDARKASFAPVAETVEKSGMEFGAITPIGMPNDWPILIDASVAASDYVIIGSGIRKSKLAIPGRILASLPNAQVLKGLGRELTV